MTEGWENVRAVKPAIRWAIFAAIAIVALVVTAALKPIPQPQSYHHFADTRALFGIANAGDVLSNLAFLLAPVITTWLRATPAWSGTACR